MSAEPVLLREEVRMLTFPVRLRPRMRALAELLVEAEGFKKEAGHATDQTL